MDPTGHHILFYDGTCRFCDRFVQLGLRHDRRGVWRYSPLQSEFAARELARYGIDTSVLDSIHVLADYGTPRERLVSSSDAGLLVWRTLSGWPGAVGYALSIFPHFIREPVYRLVANNRYRWFGRYDVCKMPKPEQLPLFIHNQPQAPVTGEASVDPTTAIPNSAFNPNSEP